MGSSTVSRRLRCALMGMVLGLAAAATLWQCAVAGCLMLSLSAGTDLSLVGLRTHVSDDGDLAVALQPRSLAVELALGLLLGLSGGLLMAERRRPGRVFASGAKPSGRP